MKHKESLARYHKIIELNKTKSKSEIAKIYGITRQRIQQIIKRGEPIDIVGRIKYDRIKYKRPVNIYNCLRQRCVNKNNKDYHHYGGRGIKIDTSWKNFDNFWDDVKEGYKKDLTIDRIDNNKGYIKGNIHWITLTQQSKNRRPFKEWKLESDYWYNRKKYYKKLSPTSNKNSIAKL